MSELAIPNRNTGAIVPAETAPSALMAWAQEAQQAAQIAEALARTSFVPTTMRGKPDDVMAAILAGNELGLPPMAALRSLDIIQGTPGLRAHAMRGLIQSHGHTVQLVESTDTRCVMRGMRKGEDLWQQVEWKIERAEQLGLTGKPEWKKQPQTMLVARATGEICRLIAADVLHAMPYAAEELGDGDFDAVAPTTRVTAEEITRQPVQQQAGEAVVVAPQTTERMISEGQQKKMGALMREHGITDRDTALAFVNDVIGREVASRNELTLDEAGQVIDTLESVAPHADDDAVDGDVVEDAPAVQAS